MNTLRPLILILSLILATAAPVVLAAPQSGPLEVIESLHGTLLSVMKEGDKIGYRGRYERLEPAIQASFDLPFVARTVVGRYWETFTPEQRSRFVETFSKLSVATYAANFDAYSGERFKIVSEKELAGGKSEVQTKLIKPDGEEVRLDYLLYRVNVQWRIINVIANGVSDLALKRADYSAFLKSKGFDALLVKLNEKISQYAH
jgi:phospholipid transport system substrate-binding protein